MIWIVLACIFGVFMGKVIRDEGLGFIGGTFCGFVGWFLAFVFTGAAISGNKFSKVCSRPSRVS
jgi:hypothetical protein